MGLNQDASRMKIWLQNSWRKQGRVDLSQLYYILYHKEISGYYDEASKGFKVPSYYSLYFLFDN